jgi:hypothetical protein
VGFQFNGIFAVADKPVFDMALQRWPFCRGRRIKTPFVGFGLAGPDPNDAETDTDAELLLAQIDDLATGLPTWSQQFPAITFIYVEAECFGGLCEYTGYACRNGQILHRQTAPPHSDEADARLIRLLRWLGIEQDHTYFPPFERSYFAVPSEH